MEQHGIESGAGNRMELFQSSPLDALKKTLPGTQFLGYETTDGRGDAWWASSPATNWSSRSTKSGTSSPICLVLDKTPFYGESGGQVGDTGEIVGPGFPLRRHRHAEGRRLHAAPRPSAQREDRAGRDRHGRVDAARRAGIRRAHSATHMLHYALQKHLGKHAQQQGSKVDRDWLRFDFTNPSGGRRRTTGRHRNGSQRAGGHGGQDPMAQPAAGPGPRSRRHDALRRKVSRHRADGLDRRVQPGTVRRHAPGQQRAGRPVQDRRRGERVGRHAADHGPDRHGGAGSTCASTKRRWPRRPRYCACPLARCRTAWRRWPRKLRELKKQAAAAPRAGGVTADKLLADAARDGRREDRRGRSARRPMPTPMRQIDRSTAQDGQPRGRAAGFDGRGQGDAGGRHQPRSASPRRERRQVDQGAAEVVGGSGGGKPDMAQAGGKHPEKLAEALAAGRANIEALLAK